MKLSLQGEDKAPEVDMSSHEATPHPSESIAQQTNASRDLGGEGSRVAVEEDATQMNVDGSVSRGEVERSGASLSELFAFKCDFTVGRNVSSMAWNRVSGHLCMFW